MTEASEELVQAAVVQAFRLERGRVLSGLRRLTTSLDEAEDLLAIALTRALEHWPKEGIPDRPGAWLMTVARNAALGSQRHHKVAQEKHSDPAFPVERESLPFEESSEYPDERLSLLFTCCHPSLSQEAQVALTLSTLSGLTTPEIARAFLTSEVTMAQRLVRAKKKIRSAGVPYQVPEPEQLGERVSGVLQVIYLIFTEGYRGSSGHERIRAELCEDALLIAHALTTLLPNNPEALGLEALLWFHHARRDARQDPDGLIIHLDAQDRSLFRQREIAHGERLLMTALEHKTLGAYQLQAAIAAQHCLAPSYASTPWETIAALYAKLNELSPSPVVLLNRAAAIGLGRGPRFGLEEMARAGLIRSLNDYAPYHAARGELLRLSGEPAAARSALKRALELVQNGAEVTHLERRIKEIEESLS